MEGRKIELRENQDAFIEGKSIFKKGQEVNVLRSNGKLETGKIVDFDDETVTLNFKVDDKKMGSKTVVREEFIKWQKVA